MQTVIKELAGPGVELKTSHQEKKQADKLFGKQVSNNPLLGKKEKDALLGVLAAFNGVVQKHPCGRNSTN